VMPSPNESDGEDVILAVEMTNLCQALNCLPRAGGLLDQDSYQVWLMQKVLEAQAERAELDRKRTESQNRIKSK
jgi:hypothetical protein